MAPRPLLLLAALASSSPLAAQVLDASLVVPPFGAYTFDRAVCNAQGAALDTVGTGLTWNVSGLPWSADAPVIYTVMNAAANPFATLAPTANAALIESTPGQGALHWFYRNTLTELESVGVVVDIPGFPATLEPDCPQLLLTYPAPLGTVVQPGLAGCDALVDAVERKVLASGTLQTPAGSHPGMVLIRTSICGEDPLGKGGSICDHRYAWYPPGNLLKPLLTVFLVDQEWETAILLTPTGFLGVPEAADAMPFTIGPNPATGHLVVQHRAGAPLGEVELRASDGRLLLSEQLRTDRWVLDVQHLAPGLYSVARTANGQRAMARFVKE